MLPSDATLKPTGSLSAQLQAVRGGDLFFADAPRSDLAAELAPFYKGDVGLRGVKGDKGDPGDSNMYWSGTNW